MSRVTVMREIAAVEAGETRPFERASSDPGAIKQAEDLLDAKLSYPRINQPQ